MGESFVPPRITGQIFGVIPHLARELATIFSRELIAEIEALGGTVRVPATYANRVGLDEWAHDADLLVAIIPLLSPIPSPIIP